MTLSTTLTTPIIVGVDFGTTASGISFSRALPPQPSVYPPPEVYKNWPLGAGEGKVPSRVALAADNIDHGFRADDRPIWGFAVRPDMNAYSWFKLLLDAQGPLTDWDDTDALGVAGSLGIFRHLKLPAETVAAGYLQQIYQRLLRILNSCPPLHFWFPVPASWSMEALAATERAARRAGFGERPGDRLTFIAEPEAAAFGALVSLAVPFEDNQAVMVVDCGGGTVDATTMLITKANPFEWRRLTVFQGGRCAGSSIDIRIHKLMAERFRNAFVEVPLRFKGPGSTFMICISKAELEPCFDPVVKKIEGIIHAQLVAVKSFSDCSVSVRKQRIILVGGLAQSAYVQHAIRYRFETPNMAAEVPHEARLAVVRGAALRGMQG
ncbi:hypothetical protein BDV19DRAFT_389700 [Aspergillus venezuelensis]